MKCENFGIITDNPSIKVMYELNKNLYKNAKKEFGKITYVNLNLLINKNKKVYKINDPKNLSSVFDIYTPKNYSDLESFLLKKRYVLSVSLGRTFKYFKTWYVLKKTKSKLFYLLNLGIISTKINFYSKSLFENILTKIKNFFFVDVAFKIYRCCVLLKIFPNIDIVFEASKIFYDLYDRSPAKIIEKKLGIKNLALYQKLYHINSRAYDQVLDQIKNIDEKYITFLDSGFDHPDRERFVKKATSIQRKKYYELLKKILLKFSKIYKKQIIFCCHPKSDEKQIKKYIPKVKLIKFKTREYVLKSKIIFFHESSSALDGIILKKKVWVLKSNTMGKFFESRNNVYPNFINCPSSDMEKLSNMSEKDIRKKIINYDFKLFNKKIISYLVKNQQSLKFIEKCIKSRSINSQNHKTLKGGDEVIIYLKKIINYRNLKNKKN